MDVRSCSYYICGFAERAKITTEDEPLTYSLSSGALMINQFPCAPDMVVVIVEVCQCYQISREDFSTKVGSS